jgi:hypothetical protein
VLTFSVTPSQQEPATHEMSCKRTTVDRVKLDALVYPKFMSQSLISVCHYSRSFYTSAAEQLVRANGDLRPATIFIDLYVERAKGPRQEGAMSRQRVSEGLVASLWPSATAIDGEGGKAPLTMHRK